MEWSSENNNAEISAEKNIIFKALSLFREKTRFFQGFNIEVEKRIPVGSGLGGGSSDAAAALLTLNKLTNFPLNRDELLKLAGNLGSDVPFFIYETAAARVTGRGECIAPVNAPFNHYVLVNPGFPSGTAAAYKLLDEYREKNQTAAKNGCSNDFLDCFRDPEKSIYDAIISKLWQLGADFASLSGSGSTCFGAFKETQQAQNAVKALDGEWGFVKYCVPYC
jgi:4-diphosphocytidyl-2-C-methyl-D-erythritol kinase